MKKEPIQEKKCDCCGWDDNGYQHEPYCSVNTPKLESWEEEFDKLDDGLYINDSKLISFIKEVEQKAREETKQKIIKLIKEKGLHLGYANHIVDDIEKL